MVACETAAGAAIAGLRAMVSDSAHICIGLNPKTKLSGNLLEDEKVLGIVTVGIGHNASLPGGKNRSRTYSIRGCFVHVGL